ncbi:uncharacterized protein LOC131225186 isoform X2 [Magnolia sinica]|uniref:uncharacterized protein LOC131225186 isoform X2 n=1 Tax=Magnolia sinica TaxID=86752 RepID=UPI00265A6FE3|nr:uncharacterized protein LOC131225186 isoform X2 [Magnolia sinica]
MLNLGRWLILFQTVHSAAIFDAASVALENASLDSKFLGNIFSRIGILSVKRRRREMFRLHRHKQEKSGERVDFKFSHFHALQVAKGWDKLFISIISVETGKTIAKSSKAIVRSGNCQWSEALSESIWVSQDNASKEFEESLFKFVVSMGSARSGILGEAVVNLADYMSSRAAVPVSLPLKKCNYGTILQVKIQCLSPRPRDEKKSKETTSHLEDTNMEYDDMDNKSDGSDNMFNKSSGSSSGNHLGGNSHPGEIGIRDMSFSVSGSHHSSDSGEGSVGRVASSPRNSINNGDAYIPVRRQDSAASQNSANVGNGPGDDPSRSNPSSFNSRVAGSGNHLQKQWQELTGQSSSHGLAPISLRPANSSKDLLEAAEDTIEELHAESKMWERNACKLKLDLEILRKDFSDQSRRLADLEMELSAACTERDGFKLEIEQLQLSLDKLVAKQNPADSSKSRADDLSHMQRELENEIKFQKESNANMAVQLKKTQESNIELVSILQELEETIEKQRLEIENLSAQKAEFGDMKGYRHGTEESGQSDQTDGISVRNTSAGPNDQGGSVHQDTTGNSHEQAWMKDNLSLEHQLTELQESQRKMQSVVQLLEKSLEDKNQEIQLEKELRDQSLLDIEAEWACKLSAKEEEIFKLEAKLSDSVNAPSSPKTGSAYGGYPDMVNEIAALRAKVQELERDCNELTDENLELILKMKESEGDITTGIGSDEFQYSATTSESEIGQLKSQVHQLEQQLKEMEMLNEVAANHLQTQIDLQKKSADLESELQSFKAKACNLSGELSKSQLEVEKKEMEVTALQQEIESYRVREIDWENQLDVASTRESVESNSLVELSEIFSEMYKQLQLALATLKKPWYDIDSDVQIEHQDGLHLLHSISTDGVIQKKQAEDMVNDFRELNDLLGEKIAKCKAFERASDAQKLLNDYILKENTLSLSIQELENLKMELQSKIADMGKELDVSRSVMAELESGILLKEEEIEVLQHSRMELEVQVSNLSKEKDQLEESLDTAKRESSITTKCLDDVRQDLVVLTYNMDSHVSANKMLERKSTELESSRHELEIHVSELEEENVQLSERLSGLEAQLRHLTDERESSRLELERSRRLVADLKNEVEKLGIEMEMQKADLKQKLQETQKQWSEAEEKLEISKRSHSKLQATVEGLIEECTSLQKLNEELRRQRLKLHENCTHLEAELRESRKNFSECCKKVEHLEEKYSSMHKDAASKEKLLTSELDSLLHEHKQNEEKLILAESLLKQTHLDKTTEAENLQREVAHLTAQIVATHDERERMASEAVLEVSRLRADKSKLENSLQEYHAKARLYETELCALQLESESKVQGLTDMLSASKQNEELFMAEREHMKRSLEDVKLSEERLKSIVSEIEMKLKASEYERQLLTEETASLKVQLQDMARLQDEISALKSMLDETKYEKGKLETSLQELSMDCEELKVERFSFMEKFSNMHKALSEGEECIRSKVALEEKLLRLECELTAKEASCANDVELKNELSRIKRTNSQFQRKIQCLEEEKEECLRRAQGLEEELKLKRENKHLDEKQILSGSSNKNLPESSESNLVKPLEGNEFSNSKMEAQKDFPNSQSDNMLLEHKERPQGAVDLVSKVQLLETELAEALEANNKRLVGEYEGMERKASSLEEELRDMHDRYFHMSLRFAEVEAEREELVMKVKTLNNGKRWFS